MKNKGITLIALVITIIILLILAGISISALTNQGLFTQTNVAKKETQRAQVAEWLNLKLMEEQMQNPTGTAEEIIEATRAASYDNAELAKMGKTVVIDDNISTVEDGEEVAVYFYVQVDEDVYKVEMAGTKFIGEKDKFPPVVTLESITSTTDSITVKITTSRNEEGKIEIYIKSEDDTDYTLEKTAVGEEATGLEYTIENLEQVTKYIIKIVATAKNEQTKEVIAEQTTLKVPISVVPTETTTHTAAVITYSWDELSAIAKMISNNSAITNDTLEVSVTFNGEEKKLGVGDTATVDEKTVRILGFNHDTLTNASAYGTTTATGQAGISFEYVDFLLSSTAMNSSSNTNSGGWGACPLNSSLNNTTYNSLSIKDKIKQVEKEFIQIYNDESSKTTSSDYLWLLSCGEIWNTSGYAIATEGSQYKYYKTTLGSTAYTSSTNVTKKPNTSSATYWWLRSPLYNVGVSFSLVHSEGFCSGNAASFSYGVAPGFSI